MAHDTKLDPNDLDMLRYAVRYLASEEIPIGINITDDGHKHRHGITEETCDRCCMIRKARDYLQRNKSGA